MRNPPRFFIVDRLAIRQEEIIALRRLFYKDDATKLCLTMNALDDSPVYTRYKVEKMPRGVR